MDKRTVASLETTSPATVGVMDRSEVLSGRSRASRMSISLRASKAGDRDFLMGVYESTRSDEFRAAGLDEQTLRNLLAQQFSMQDVYYRRHYANARFDIVMNGEDAIGRLYHDWNFDSREACVIDIALVPSYRGAGIGTRLMQAVVAEAARRNMAVRLHVELDNPVRALYRRLGFEPVGQNGVYEQMRRPAEPFDGEGAEPVVGLVAEPMA
jgi:ribosomal protein S18 acetylase RimI-like enzyme